MVSDRDPSDTFDLFRCLDANTGKERWSVRTLAQGHLDYGNSPRATPLLHGELAFLLGAFGDLICVRLDSGEERWRMNIRRQFGATDKLVWGVASSPLIVDGKLILNPGGPSASMVALEPETGKVVWKSPGEPAAFASLVVHRAGGTTRIVGYDATSLGGWDAETGERLWKHVPPVPNDFNVPTPLLWNGDILVSTENNGTRLFGWDAQRKLAPEPRGTNSDLAPDSHTPVLVRDRLFGVWGALWCLDVANGLKTVWSADDRAFRGYASIVASDERLLVISQDGELLLIDAHSDGFKLLARRNLFDDETVYSHPAVVGNRLYVRGGGGVIAVDLASPSKPAD